MAVLSLIPAVGAGLIWFPVALYLYAVGDMKEATILILFGVFVIGLVDNILRPILVGRDTKLPDYVVLFSTLGGLAMFGITGFAVGHCWLPFLWRSGVSLSVNLTRNVPALPAESEPDEASSGSEQR